MSQWTEASVDSLEPKQHFWDVTVESLEEKKSDLRL